MTWDATREAEALQQSCPTPTQHGYAEGRSRRTCPACLAAALQGARDGALEEAARQADGCDCPARGCDHDLIARQIRDLRGPVQTVAKCWRCGDTGTIPEGRVGAGEKCLACETLAPPRSASNAIRSSAAEKASSGPAPAPPLGVQEGGNSSETGGPPPEPQPPLVFDHEKYARIEAEARAYHGPAAPQPRVEEPERCECGHTLYFHEGHERAPMPCMSDREGLAGMHNGWCGCDAFRPAPSKGSV